MLWSHNLSDVASLPLRGCVMNQAEIQQGTYNIAQVLAAEADEITEVCPISIETVPC
jgi:hypothetical protein